MSAGLVSLAKPSRRWPSRGDVALTRALVPVLSRALRALPGRLLALARRRWWLTLLGLLMARRLARLPKMVRRRGQRRVTADPKALDGYPVGTEVHMGFRRCSFVWSAEHLSGRTIAAWEHRTDAADAAFRPGMGVEAFCAAVAGMSQPPGWVDWALLDEGCRFFVQVWPLVVYSFSWALLGGFGAESAAAVLLQSRYWAAEGEGGKADTWGRLLETLCWLYDAAAHGAAGYRPGGRAWKACLHVRYLHCRTRATLRASGKWDTERFGEPINQTQVAGTLLGSSVLLLQGKEELLGMPLSLRKKEAFTHLWRVIGFLFGLDEAFNPNAGGYAQAVTNMQSIFSQGIPAFPDPELAGSLSRHICESVAHGLRSECGVPASAGMVSATAWHFLGEPYGAAICLPASSWPTRALSLCHMMVMRFVFSWHFVPGAPRAYERLLRSLFTATVLQIRRRQPQCRFGACPLTSKARPTTPKACPVTSKVGDVCPAAIVGL